MSSTSAFLQHLGVDSSAVVANANAKCLVAMSNLCFDPARIRVSKSVSEQFKRNPANLIAGSWTKGSLL
jgi:hypothetical protein